MTVRIKRIKRKSEITCFASLVIMTSFYAGTAKVKKSKSYRYNIRNTDCGSMKDRPLGCQVAKCQEEATGHFHGSNILICGTSTRSASKILLQSWEKLSAVLALW